MVVVHLVSSMVYAKNFSASIIIYLLYFESYDFKVTLCLMSIFDIERK